MKTKASERDLERALGVVETWQMRWMKQDDYAERATSIDANMRYNLANDLAEALAEERNSLPESVLDGLEFEERRCGRLHGPLLQALEDLKAWQSGEVGE